MPLTMDVFSGDAFNAVTMTEAIDRMEFVPQALDGMPGLFVDKPVRTKGIWIEDRGDGPRIIPTTPRGAPPTARGSNLRNARNFATVRIAESSTIYADELQDIRAFGKETELMQLQDEIASRQKILGDDMNLTREHYALGAIQGKMLDADGSTLFNWATEFGQSLPTEIDFDLDNASPGSGVLRKKCNAVVRGTSRALKGRGGPGVQIVGLAGDNFWDDFTGHSEVRETFLNQQEARELRKGTAWKTFDFGDITWANYRGTDDNTTVAVPTDKVKFFPVGAGIFQRAWSPAERFEFVNTLGRPRYTWVVRDKDRDMWADVEMYSYPLYVCTQCDALFSGRRT